MESTDVCVIGAGMAGLAAAHEVASTGARVVVLEATRRPGGRARTVRPRWAGGRIVECGPEFVDAGHERLRAACRDAGVHLTPVGGELYSYRDGVLAPGSRHPSNDPAEARLQQAYWSRMHDLASGVADPDRPNDHPDAVGLDGRSVTALFDEIAATVDAPPEARIQLGRFVQGVLGAEPDHVSALFLVQQAALDHDGGSARVDEGLGAVAAHLAATLPPPSEVRLATPVTALAHHDDHAIVTTSRGLLRARRVVLAVPLPALARLPATPALDAEWLAAARALRYGSLVKTTLAAPGVTMPGWAVASDLPTALAWSPAAGLVTTYTGASRADRLAARAPHDVVAQAASDVALISGRPVPPVGGTWRWTPATRRGGCYVVFGPGQVGAHWEPLRRRAGVLALAGEHCGRTTGYVEGAMEAGVRAARQLLG